jgi:hypothetical protein
VLNFREVRGFTFGDLGEEQVVVLPLSCSILVEISRLFGKSSVISTMRGLVAVRFAMQSTVITISVQHV